MRLDRFGQYRLGAFTWMINGLISPLFLMAVWLVVGKHSTLNFNQSEIITYFFLSIFVYRITQTWAFESLGYAITSGKLSSSLVKPYPYLLEDLGSLIGNKLIRFLTLIPAFFILLIFLYPHLSVNFTSSSILIFLLSLFLGLAINYFLQHILVTLVFWLEEYSSLNMLHSLLSETLNGSLIPLALAPPILANLILYSPFRYYLSFPLEIALNQLTPFQLTLGFSLGISYLFFFVFLHHILFNLGLKRYGAYGH